MFRKEAYRKCFFRIAIGILALVLVMVGGGEATKFINDNATGGDCISIGIWDAANKTCTLTTNLAETVQIDNDGITLNGNGHIIMGSGTGSGVYLLGRSGVTIKSLTVKNFTDGIYYDNEPPNSSFENTLIDNIANSNYRNGILFSYSGGRNNLTNNTANFNLGSGIVLEEGSSNSTLLYNNASYNNNTGIYLFHSSNNMLIGNNASNNVYNGVLSYQTSTNTLKNNILNSNRYGIFFVSSFRSTFINNIANSNYDNGIYIYYYSSENNLTNNTANFNLGSGIVLGHADSNNTLLGNNASNNNNSGIYVANSLHNNTVTGNTASNNSYGIYLQSSSNNTIYNNIFNNTNNAFDNGYNTWNITKTAGTNIIGGAWLGGNYWSDYAGKDLDGDGLGDTLLPYNSSGNITNGGDFLPLIIAPTTTTGSISGFKFNDINGNGTWDPVEPGLANWTIVLTMPDGSNITNTTNTDGFYRFSNLSAGNYTIEEILKPGWVRTFPSVSVRNITILKGENLIDIDFGNMQVQIPQETFNISGFKVNDTNGNGVWDSGEKGIENWNINLLNDTGEQIASTSTNASGFYKFTDLNPGTYKVTEETKPGFTSTSATSRVITIENMDVTDVNFLNRVKVIPPPAKTNTISGFKVNDLNGNGRWDEGEKGLKGWNIKLIGIVPETADINMETTTDDQGFYSFENLPSGKYLVEETVKGDYVPDSPVIVVDLENGTNSKNNNFMNRPVSSLIPDLSGLFK